MQNDGNASWATSGRGNGTYIYQVQGCNGGGCGPFSSQVKVTVALIPAVPSGRPVQVLSPTYKGRYTVSWSGVDGATRYEVQYQSPNESETTYSGAENTFTGILINTSGTVNFQVRACNDTGCSDWSPSASAQFASE